MKAHIICVSNSIEAIVLDDLEKAKKRMKKISDAHYETSKFNFVSREDYNTCYFWHIHSIKITDTGCYLLGEPLL